MTTTTTIKKTKNNNNNKFSKNEFRQKIKVKKVF